MEIFFCFKMFNSICTKRKLQNQLLENICSNAHFMFCSLQCLFLNKNEVLLRCTLFPAGTASHAKQTFRYPGCFFLTTLPFTTYQVPYPSSIISCVSLQYDSHLLLERKDIRQHCAQTNLDSPAFQPYNSEDRFAMKNHILCSE